MFQAALIPTVLLVPPQQTPVPIATPITSSKLVRQSVVNAQDSQAVKPVHPLTQTPAPPVPLDTMSIMEFVLHVQPGAKPVHQPPVPP